MLNSQTKLNFPSFNFKLKREGEDEYIFDIIRKKMVLLTPEEWVRQNAVHYLINKKNYPKNLFQIEQSVKLNNLTKRFDILIFDNDINPLILVECKAPSLPINQSTFEQVSRYNMEINAKLLWLTNGLTHFCIKHKNGNYQFMNEIPDYKTLT